MLKLINTSSVLRLRLLSPLFFKMIDTEHLM